MCATRGGVEVGVCRTYEGGLQPGDPCSYSSQCPTGNFCDSTSHTCLVGAALFQPCEATNSICASGRCEFRTDAGNQSICVPFLNQGDPCTSVSDQDCGPTMRCVEGHAGLWCAAKAAAGESCSSDTDCASGNRCSNGVCAVGVCARDSCQNCSETSGLTLMLFLSMVVVGNPLKRWRRRRSG
jgi:hypothetical protein